MALLSVSPLFRLVLRLAGFRITFEVSRPAPDGDGPEDYVEEICGSILPEVFPAAQESRSPADPSVRPPGLTSGAAETTQVTTWAERHRRASEAGESAAQFLIHGGTWMTARAPIGQLGELTNRTWVVVRGKSGLLRDCRDGVICAKKGQGPSGLADLIGTPPCPEAVYHGFPSAAEADSYLAQYSKTTKENHPGPTHSGRKPQ